MRLNLGAGKVILPAKPGARPPDPTLEFPPECFEGDWLNIDKYHNPGIDVVLDLFKFPWLNPATGQPFEDNSVDFIWCSHIVEHIPHQVALTPKLPWYLQRHYAPLVDDYDGWFVFFEECWRILQPGGVICLTVPFALSVGAISDPTHTRYVFPMTILSYLTVPYDSAPFDYTLKCKYEHVTPTYIKYTDYWTDKLLPLPQEEQIKTAFTYFNVAETFVINLKAIKE